MLCIVEIHGLSEQFLGRYTIYLISLIRIGTASCLLTLNNKKKTKKLVLINIRSVEQKVWGHSNFCLMENNWLLIGFLWWLIHESGGKLIFH